MVERGAVSSKPFQLGFPIQRCTFAFSSDLLRAADSDAGYPRASGTAKPGTQHFVRADTQV